MKFIGEQILRAAVYRVGEGEFVTKINGVVSAVSGEKLSEVLAAANSEVKNFVMGDFPEVLASDAATCAAGGSLSFSSVERIISKSAGAVSKTASSLATRAASMSGGQVAVAVGVTAAVAVGATCAYRHIKRKKAEKAPA